MDTSSGLAPRQSVLDRLRAPMAFLLIAAGTVGASYYFFLQKKTEYYTNRDARLIARAAQQVSRSVRTAAGILKNAAPLDEAELKTLYKIDGTAPDEQRLPSKIFKDIRKVALNPGDKPAEHRAATRSNDGLLLDFNLVNEDERVEMQGQVELQQLLKPVQQSIAGVFDTFFILDASGNVIYQAQRASGDDSGSHMKMLRVRQLAVSRTFEKAQLLAVTELMSVSRQMPVQLGDNAYQLFSVPIPSTVHIDEGAHEKNEAGLSETWVVCGLVSAGEFRSRSLQISVTVLSCLAAAMLLVIFSWPFVKVAMTGAQNKTTLFDVVLLGLCGILGASIVCLVAVDWLTYDKLQQSADDQLVKLASGIEGKFNADIATAVDQLDVLQRWANTQPASAPAKRGDLLTLGNFDASFFQSFALIDEKGMPVAKWSVDSVVPPLVKAVNRNYFLAAKNKGRDYLSIVPRPGVTRRLAIDSVRSTTTGQTEVVFARAADEMPGLRPPNDRAFAVIAMSVSSQLSVLNATVPEDFGFAVVDPVGKVLFHSQSERNTGENFFTETDQDPKLRAAVVARQSETMDVRYWGDDYRAHVHPLKALPWTLVTFREKNGLRAVNTGALLTAMLFLLVLHGGGLLLFVSIVLLLRPRYRAPWLWPDPSRLRDYSDLAIAFVALLVAAVCLIGSLGGGALVVFPFAFVPFVLVVTYLFVRHTRRLRRSFFVGAAVFATVVLAAVAWRSTDWSNAGVVAAKTVASVMLLLVLARAVSRPSAEPAGAGARERQMTLPLAYVSVAALLLLLVSIVPTIAFFKAACEVQVMTYTKFVQIQLARDLQNRWWRLAGEFSESRGKGKERVRLARWNDRHDIHSDASTDLHATLPAHAPARGRDDSMVMFPWVEDLLPHYSEASVNTRELFHDGAADDQWEWTREGGTLYLTMRNPDPVPNFMIGSALPSPFPSFGGGSYRTPIGAVSMLLILALVLGIAQFIARRVFLVDVVHPLWLARGFLGLRRVICHPCDDASALRLFREFTKLDLTKQADLEITQTAPQSFPTFARTVLIDHLGYEFAAGESAAMVRAMLDRLMRNPDRTVVIRPTSMAVITHAILQGPDRDAWSRLLSSFVWVNGSQINADGRGVSVSGARSTFDDSTPPPVGQKGWLKRLLHRVYLATGFGNYFEQMADSRVVDRAIAAEIRGDAYLETLIGELESVASGRDQVLDEIGERAEEYYTALWHPCSAGEKLVLMQVAQTGLVNSKARKDVRRLLARGLLQRDPQLRLMNETFRRFVCVQAATSSLSSRLEEDLAGDAWNRVRMPFFAGVVVVLLFFFGTQRELFDSTFAVVGGLAATIPALLKMLSSFGERGAVKAA
jgi:uncharacterized membrane protein YjjP (DUF1212 family)